MLCITRTSQNKKKRYITENITKLLILLLIITVYAFNADKNISYAVKVLYFLVMTFLLIINNKTLSLHFLWGLLILGTSALTMLWVGINDGTIYNFLWLAQAIVIFVITIPFIDS